MPAVACPSPLLKGIFPDRVATAELRVFRGGVHIAEEDAACIPRANSKRRDEFVAGRLCAAAALASLGIQSSRVGRDAGGAPIWPPGSLGSISHTDDIAAAVAARCDQYHAAGLDIERVGAVEPPLWPMVFCEAETVQLQAVDPDARKTLATALFAAKEAFYKAQWPITREWLDFLDVEIVLNGQAFVVLPRSRRAWIRVLGVQPGGLFEVQDDIVVASVLISAR
jgi:4'-phosphopantetheinyl transferase EntD